MGKFGQQLKEMGTSLLNAAAGGVLGIQFGKQNDKRQLEMQEKLSEMQYKQNAALMGMSFDRQMEMWRDTSYPAQKEMMKKAGLNPGLMYGMGGGGGQSTGSGGASVGGGSAPVGGGEAMQGMAMMIQQRLMETQTKKLEAETNNINEDTKNKPKQGANIEADTELKKMNWNIAAIQEKIMGDTQNSVVAKAMTELRTLTAQMHEAETKNRITQETAQAAIEKAKLDVAVAATDNELKKAQKRATEKGIEKADEEINKIRTEIQNIKDYYELDNYIEREKVRLIDKGINVAIITSVLGGIMNLATGGRR